MPGLTFKHRFFRANLVALAGLAVAGAMVLYDGSFRDAGPFLRCAAAGAFVAGLLVAGLFGQSGCRGWFLAGLGFSLATVLGVIFGVIFLPLEALLMQGRSQIAAGIAPLGWALAFVLGALWDTAGVLMAWVLVLAGVHQGAKRKGVRADAV